MEFISAASKQYEVSEDSLIIMDISSEATQVDHRIANVSDEQIETYVGKGV